MIRAFAMRLATSVLPAAVALVAATGASAQDVSATTPEKSGAAMREMVEHTVIVLKNIFEAPLHPIVSGIGAGGGIGAGVGYDTPGHAPWVANAHALYTINQYWLVQGSLGFKNRRTQLEAYGRTRDMVRLSYYGPGNNSNEFNRTSYSYRDPVIGALGAFRATPWLTLGGRAEYLWPNVRSGERKPSIEQVFTPSDAPGLFTKVRFGRYQASVEASIPAALGDAFYQGTRARAAYGIYDDLTLNQFNFRRLDVEAQQTFAGFAAHHRVILNGWVSTSMTDDGQEVPFYLQQTLGGRSRIRAVHEHRLGYEGSEATLRGFGNLRFRDRNLMLAQAEYRLPLWGPVDAAVFADAGKVASARSELDLNDLRRDFGFSLSLVNAWFTLARVDVAFGSGEGARLLLSLGDLTP